jgi:hypothetical protein
MNRNRSTHVLLVSWGQRRGGLPFPDPIYYYQVDFHSCDHYAWGDTNEQEQEYGILLVSWGLGDRVGGGGSTLP